MTDIKEIARESAVDGMVRLSLAECLIDIARSEGEAKALNKRLNEK